MQLRSIMLITEFACVREQILDSTDETAGQLIFFETMRVGVEIFSGLYECILQGSPQSCCLLFQCVLAIISSQAITDVIIRRIRN